MAGQLRHPEYLAHWVGILKGDAQAIWTAGARASEAAAYLSKVAGHDTSAADETELVA
jgi:antirestriction protein ArdC